MQNRISRLIAALTLAGWGLCFPIGGRPSYTRDAVVRNIRIDAPIVAAALTYSPPKGVLSAAESDRLHPAHALLAVGAIAPDFTGLDAQNRPVRLSEFKGRVVVIDFWASWCVPCVESMPRNQEVAKKLQAEGLPVVVLAVDNSDERDGYTAWVKDRSAQFSALTFVRIPPENDVRGKLFHVSSIPTQYVLDKAGIVRASFVGYGGPTADLEKAIRGAFDVSTR